MLGVAELSDYGVWGLFGSEGGVAAEWVIPGAEQGLCESDGV